MSSGFSIGANKLQLERERKPNVVSVLIRNII